MNKKRNYLTKVVAILLTCILFITSIGIEDVSAFWNRDAKNDIREDAKVTVELMHCYHKDTHYDSGGRHIYSESIVKEDKDSWLADSKNNSKKKPAVKTVEIQPGVLGNTQAGLECIDTNKYFYEYSLTYAESELVDYVLITQPEITHCSDNDSKRPANLREEHVRMYWIGSYNKSMTEVTGKWTGNGYDENDTDIGWYDFKNESFPSIDSSLSQQTWETVGDHEAFQNNKSFVFTKKMGENGMEFIYLLEGTKTVNANDGSFLDITGGIYDYLKSADASTVDKAERRYNKTYTSSGESNASADPGFNHRDQSHDGRPLGYGEHVNAIIGIVFYNAVQFDANGGTFGEGSVYRMQTYSNSKQGRLYSWYEDRSKRIWYSDIDVSNPQVSTQYGNVSVKAPTRPGYEFLGWYAAETGSDGSIARDSDGNILLTDIPVYDLDGKAVLTYTDSSGNTKASPYFDSNGSWIYKGNVTAAAKWKVVGYYTLKYDSGNSSTAGVVPKSEEITVGNGTDLAECSLPGNRYTVKFEVTTNNSGSEAKYPAIVSGSFNQRAWSVSYKKASNSKTVSVGEMKGGSYYSGVDNEKNDVVTATAVYQDYSFVLPNANCGDFKFEGWYDAYDYKTGIFGNKIGNAGDTLTLSCSSNVDRTLYAKWVPKEYTLKFDYNVPDYVKNSKLGYTLSGDSESSKIVYYDQAVGEIPAPSLTGHTLMGWSRLKDVFSEVTESVVYDKSFSTIYAQWSPTTYEIEYRLNGGNVPDNPYFGSYYVEAAIKSPTRNGYRFIGWKITGLDSNKHIINGMEITSKEYAISTTGNSISVLGLRATEGTVTFEAMWQEESYSLSYDYRRRSDNVILKPTDEAIAAAGNPISYTATTPAFNLTAPEIKGYSFYYWGGTGITEKMSSLTINTGTTGDKEFIAYYDPNEYLIVYDLSGGSWGKNASHPESAKYDTTFTVSSPVLDGCEFQGWTITNMCSDCVHVIDGSEVNGTESSGVKGTSFKNLHCVNEKVVRFTAVWSAVSYNVSYDLNGGSSPSGGSYPTNVTAYSSFSVSNPVRSGKTFLGWSISGMDAGMHSLPAIGNTTSESASGIGVGVAEGMALTYGNLRYSSGTVKFVAAWGDKDRQVLFFGNGGTLSGNSVKDDWTLRFIKYGDSGFFIKTALGSSWGSDIPIASKVGYRFAGFYNSLTGGVQAFTENGLRVTGMYWDPNGRWIGPSLILYAQFVPKSYAVVFNPNGGSWLSDGTSNSKVLMTVYDSSQNNKAYSGIDVTRPGYMFGGWTTRPDGTGYSVYDVDGYNTADGGYWSEDYRK